MNYHIQRGDQSYGPYTLSDLQRYVASGHVLPTDLAKSEGTAEAVPVSQILNPSAQPQAYAPPPYVAPYQGAGGAPPVLGYQAYGQPENGASIAQFDDPPNLSWGLVLLFDAITCGLFQMVWNIIFSVWMRRVQPNSNALFFYIGGYALGIVYSVGYVPFFMEQMRHAVAHDMILTPHMTHQALLSLAAFAGWVLKLVARFAMKSSLEEHYNTVEPIGLRLSGVMVFFFGGLYIQSQLNKVNEIKQAMRYRSTAY